MVTTPLDMKYIYKRGRSLERRKSITESARIPDLSGNMNDDYYRYKVESFTRDCIDYKDAIKLLETLYASNKFDLLESSTQKVIHDVIPTVESAELPICIQYINSSDIGEVNRDRLVETAKMYKSVDRIIKNHKNLSRRFEMDTMKGKSDKEKCYRICEMVCTYSLSKFVKFNIALEEMKYLSYTSGDNIPDATLVEHVSNYFLMLDDNTEDDIDHYKSAIESSRVIAEGADVNVQYLTSNKSKKYNRYIDRINEWKLDPDKKIDTLVELARDNFSSISALSTILEYVEDFKRINEIEFDTMKIFTEFDSAMSGKAAHNIMSIIDEHNIPDVDDLMSNIKAIWEAEINDEVYADGTTKPETFTSDEIDKFKLHDLIDDAQTVGEFLDQLEKTSMKEPSLKIDKTVAANMDDLNESTVVDHTDCNGYITTMLRRYSYGGNTEAVNKMLESTMACLSNILYPHSSVAYYTLGENSFDIVVRSKYKLILSEAQEMHKGFTNFDKSFICDIANRTKFLDEMSVSSIGWVMSVLEEPSYAASVTAQEASLVFEMMAPYLAEGTIDEFLELCRHEANPKYDYIKDALSNITEGGEINPYVNHDEVFTLALETMMLTEGVASNIKNAVNDVTNAAKKVIPGKNKNQQNNNQSEGKVDTKTSGKVEDADTKDDKKTDSDTQPKEEPKNDDTEDANTKKAINSINDARLVWQGVKSKMKGASAKEQEMSRDLDLEFNHLLRTLKMTYGTDRREEIITGEVNHSISKIIKIAIGLAGIGVAAHTAVIPILGAIGLFVRSKYMTLKEKKRTLDEIDIELQVIEREIQRAEQSGSTKKYRQLLTIQKNMQRMRQDIYYSLAKKGQRVPMQSTQGLRGRD